MAQDSSFKGGQAFTFVGDNAFAFAGGNAFAFSGNHAFAFSGAIDQYGFAGAPGNPLLVAGLTASREGALMGKLPPAGVGWATAGDRSTTAAASTQPALDTAALTEWGGAPRSALIQVELLGSIGFSKAGANTLVMSVRDAGSTLKPLVSLQRPDPSYFIDQLVQVDRDSSLRGPRTPEILTQVTTPMSYFASVLNMRAERHRRTLELLDHCLRFAYAVGMRFKHAFAVARPSALSARILPMLEVPPHGAFPMGHATESHVIAGVLARLVPGLAGTHGDDVLRDTAFRISQNRVIAGLHYPVDGIAGRLLGDALVECFQVWGEGSGTCRQRTFGPTSSTTVSQLFAKSSFGDGPDCTTGTTPVTPVSTPMFATIWSAARAEWA